MSSVDFRPDHGRSGRLSMVLGGGLVLVFMAVVGAVGGYLLGRDGGTSTGALATSAPGTAVAPPPTARPTVVQSTPGARTTTSSRGLTVPSLIGVDFERARGQLRDRGLDWRLVFGSGTGRDVVRTFPRAGVDVRRGATVVLYVAGPAPARAVPDLVGDDCVDAARELAGVGFQPLYRALRRGVVLEQYPPAGTQAYWNDRITITCGTASPAPTATPTGTPTAP